MRLCDEKSGRGPITRVGRVLGISLGAAVALSGCGMVGGGDAVLAGAAPAAQGRTGPAADYPVVIGSPYSVGDTLYTPVDTLNYDEVGYAALDSEGGDTVTAAHHTLPLPSYVEVTSLTTGRTILVRLERRGPMTDNSLIALSPGASAQLGAAADTPVRVRRVNPPEPERAELRMGGQAPARLETPETLLTVLRRKLPAEGSSSLAQATPALAETPASVAKADVQIPAVAAPAPEPSPTTSPLPHPTPSAVASTPVATPPARAAAAVSAPPPRANPAATPNGAYAVQAGAFSSEDRARKVAKAIGGSISRSGKLYRVRTGPFSSRAQAEASLAKVKAAGYSDARIFTNG